MTTGRDRPDGAQQRAAQPRRPSGDVTLLLAALRSGQEGAFDELFTLVYSELVRLAHRQVGRERPGATLSATALVHEVFLRLAEGPGGASLRFENRRHFFGAAAEAMRRILVDRARERLAHKRGGGRARVGLTAAEALASPDAEQDPGEVLALDEALGSLEALDERAAAVVKLKCFVGLGMGEIAGLLGVSERTAAEDWAFAKRWLRRETATRH